MRKLLNDDEKVKEVHRLSEQYKAHLEVEILALAHKLPPDVIKLYEDQSKMNVNDLVDRANLGYILYQGEAYEVTGAKCESKSWDDHLSLHKAIGKYNIVTKILKELTDVDVTPAQRIKNLGNFLRSPKNKRSTALNAEILQENRTGTKFLKKILAVCSLFLWPLHSKLTRGTFKAWKSHGEVLTDAVTEITGPKPK